MNDHHTSYKVLLGGKTLHPSLMFVSNIGGYLNEAPFGCSTIGLAKHKNQLKLERLDIDKHFGSIQTSINYTHKFYNIGSWSEQLLVIAVLFTMGPHTAVINVIKHFYFTTETQIRQVCSKNLFQENGLCYKHVTNLLWPKPLEL